MTRASFAALLALVTLASTNAQSATSTTSLPGATSTAYLNTVAQAAGKMYFGTATDNSEWNDTVYDSILDQYQMFGQLTPANAMKWEYVEPEQGVWTFEEADALVALAHSNGQIIRGHNCVWYSELAAWVTADNFTPAELADVVVNHTGTLVSRYAGQICLGCDQRTDVFYDALNTSYIPLALYTARAADPNAKLYINEYNAEYAGPKATALMNLVTELKAGGVPLDGIGFQCHFIVGEVPTDFQTILEQFVALGVEVAITELDIRMTLPANATMLEQQKTDYESVISACEAVSGCVGATVWDFTDKYSWVPSTFPGQGEACPWDENLEKKPAYDGIVLGFQS